MQGLWVLHFLTINVGSQFEEQIYKYLLTNFSVKIGLWTESPRKPITKVSLSFKGLPILILVSNIENNHLKTFGKIQQENSIELCYSSQLKFGKNKQKLNQDESETDLIIK